MRRLAQKGSAGSRGHQSGDPGFGPRRARATAVPARGGKQSIARLGRPLRPPRGRSGPARRKRSARSTNRRARRASRRRDFVCREETRSTWLSLGLAEDSLAARSCPSLRIRGLNSTEAGSRLAPRRPRQQHRPGVFTPAPPAQIASCDCHVHGWISFSMNLPGLPLPVLRRRGGQPLSWAIAVAQSTHPRQPGLIGHPRPRRSRRRLKNISIPHRRPPARRSFEARGIVHVSFLLYHFFSEVPRPLPKWIARRAGPSNERSRHFA